MNKIIILIMIVFFCFGCSAFTQVISNKNGHTDSVVKYEQKTPTKLDFPIEKNDKDNH